MFCSYCKNEIDGDYIERTVKKGSKEVFKAYFCKDCYINLQSRNSGIGIGFLTWIITAILIAISLSRINPMFFLGLSSIFGLLLIFALCLLLCNSKPYRVAFKNFKKGGKKFVKGYGITFIICMLIYLIIIYMILISLP